MAVWDVSAADARAELYCMDHRCLVLRSSCHDDDRNERPRSAQRRNTMPHARAFHQFPLTVAARLWQQWLVNIDVAAPLARA